MSMPEQVKERFQKLEKYIDELKAKNNAEELSGNLSKNLLNLMKALSQINPFNNILIDIYAEARDLESDQRKLKDPMKKSMILMKLDFWKEKLKNTLDLIEF